MRRREFITLLGGVAASWPLATHAQQPRKIARIGYLGLGSPSESDRGAKALEAGFRDLGHVEGKTYVIDYRLANARPDLLDQLAAGLVRMQVDVIVAPTTAAAVAARNATTTIPIVFATVSAPVEVGLVSSLARPGGNATGLTYYISPAIVGKQLQLLKEIHPRVSRVALLWRPSSLARPQVAAAKKAADLLGIQLRVFEAGGLDEIEDTFRLLPAESPDAVLVLPDPILGERRTALGGLALKHRLPMMVGSREDLAAGCLMAYGASRLDLIRRSVTYVDKILNGARPADLPVEQPTKFELVINLTTASALGLALPSTLLAIADELID